MIKRGLSKERLKKFHIRRNDTVVVIAGDEKGTPRLEPLIKP